MRTSIRFLHRGRRVSLGGEHARMTLLDWLRLEQGLTGTKEGCAEGDCGACTVVLVRLRDGRPAHEPVNACILLAGQADGAAVLTIEDLAGSNGELHRVQREMVRHHGAQCGFCTPGIVMSLYALHQDGPRPVTREMATDQLAGNLCRCTGYRPIIHAALEACNAASEAERAAEVDPDDLSALDDEDDVLAGDASTFFAAPRSEAALQQLFLAHPDARLVAGATDLGLTITKGLEHPGKVIWLGRVAALDTIEHDGSTLTIGAAVTHTRAMPALGAIDPDLGEVMRRFGSVQVRNSGTVGGNIANGSPIGDLAPCLIALGAQVELQCGAVARTLALENFFLAYGKQDRLASEYVRRLIIPRVRPQARSPGEAGSAFRAYKVSKRIEEDISAVLGAFHLALDGRRVSGARIAYGGMAGTPSRARNAEDALVGADLDDDGSWTAAIDALRRDFAPIDDQRASGRYRMLVAGNLLRKALLEIGGTPTSRTRIVGTREASHDGR